MIKIEFRHWRVQSCRINCDLPLSKKGKPRPNDLWPYYRKNGGMKWGWADERGGRTSCVIWKNNETIKGMYTISTGTALCSMSDNFCYKTGRDLAFQRALEKLPPDDWQETLQEYERMKGKALEKMESEK
jgi:hypothetical protein